MDGEENNDNQAPAAEGGEQPAADMDAGQPEAPAEPEAPVAEMDGGAAASAPPEAPAEQVPVAQPEP